MEELQYFERIEKYADGKMSTIERAKFEIELKENAQLKEEYDAFLATTVALEWMVTEKLSNKESEINNKLVVKSNRNHWLAFAASILFLLFLGAASFAKLNYSNDVLVQQFYTPPNWTNIIRGNENNASQIELNQLMGSENYEKVISYLENISEKNTNQNYLLANAYLKNNQADKAINAFQKVISATDDDFKASVEWYLALSYLKNGEHKKAKKQAEIIIQKDNHPNKQKAIRLEKNLNSVWRKVIFW